MPTGTPYVRTYSSEEGEFERCITRQQRPTSAVQRCKYPLRRKRSANRWVWDMRRDGLDCIEDIRIFEGFAGGFVKPGAYTARVAIGDVEDSVSFTLVPDRRVEATAAEFEEVERLVSDLTALMNELLGGISGVRRARDQIESLITAFPTRSRSTAPGRAPSIGCRPGSATSSRSTSRPMKTRTTCRASWSNRCVICWTSSITPDPGGRRRAGTSGGSPVALGGARSRAGRDRGLGCCGGQRLGQGERGTPRLDVERLSARRGCRRSPLTEMTRPICCAELR